MGRDSTILYSSTVAGGGKILGLLSELLVPVGSPPFGLSPPQLPLTNLPPSPPQPLGDPPPPLSRSRGVRSSVIAKAKPRIGRRRTPRPLVRDVTVKNLLA